MKTILVTMMSSSITGAPQSWVDFTNILRSAFTRPDPESAVAFMRPDPKRTKKTDGLTVFIVVLGSVLVKAARKMLAKSIP